MWYLKAFMFWAGFTVINHTAFSQNRIKANGESLLKVENNSTWDETVKKGIQIAQVQAIENTFGRIIVQDNSTYIRNVQENEVVKTNSTFNFISNSYVKGEWVEDIIDPEIERKLEGNEIWVKIKVKGWVREITMPTISFEASITSCPDVKCKTNRLNDGQDLFTYFKSPEDGYLSIYLMDLSNQYAFLLLPYRRSTVSKKNVKIQADKDYIFFCRNLDYFNDKNAIDQFIASVSNNSTNEKFQLLILFSTEPLDKPVLEDESVTSRKFLDAISIKEGYSLQKGLPEFQFRNWLQDYRVHNKKVQIANIPFDVIK
ncbi:MAG: hypothetical protein WCG87_02515 [Bacteroidota bacterium]